MFILVRGVINIGAVDLNRLWNHRDWHGFWKWSGR